MYISKRRKMLRHKLKQKHANPVMKKHTAETLLKDIDVHVHRERDLPSLGSECLHTIKMLSQHMVIYKLNMVPIKPQKVLSGAQ